MTPNKVWVIWPYDGGPPVLWTEPCPFTVDDGKVVEYVRWRRVHSLSMMVKAWSM